MSDIGPVLSYDGESHLRWFAQRLFTVIV